MNTTTVTTTTTESSGTITIKVWIIYAVIFPIIAIAAIAALLILCRWLCNKRHVSVLPKSEPEKSHIINDLNNSNEATTEPLDHFVVSHEASKISKKPKKAINRLGKKDSTPSAEREREPGIENLNRALDLATEERERTDDNFHGDAVSENAFNHLKEESAPNEGIRQLKQRHVTTNRNKSLINTFKPENACVSKSKTLQDTSRILLSRRRRRKCKESAMKRNMKLIKSKLNRPKTDTDESIDETTDGSTSTVVTASEEESAIDPSFVQSGDEDCITDDEDSGTDNFTSRHSKKLKRETLNEANENMSKLSIRNGKSNQEPNTGDTPIADITKRNIKNEKAKETNIQSKSSKDSKLFTGKESIPKYQLTVSGNEASEATLTSELPHDVEAEQRTSTSSENKMKKKVTKATHEHVQRQGPLATSSFKSNVEEKADAYKGEKQKQTGDINATRHSSKLNIHDFFQGETGVSNESFEPKEKSYDNYKEFERMVMKRGTVSLNRSVSLNEMDLHKDETYSRRRKRKYQSLRQTKKESVFDVLKTLDKTPKKSILKKSKSLHLKSKGKENSESLRYEGGTTIFTDEGKEEMNLSYVHFTKDIDTCKININNVYPTAYEACTTSLTSKENKSATSKSNQMNENNESNIESQINATTIETGSDLEQSQQCGDNKPQRTDKTKSKDTETIAFASLNIHEDTNHGINHDRIGNENDSISEIVSSNLLATSDDISTLQDTDILDFPKPSMDGIESFTQLLTQTDLNEKQPEVEANRKCDDSYVVNIIKENVSDNRSESNDMISLEVGSNDKKEQETSGNHHQTAQYDDTENIKMQNLSDKVESINIPDDKETSIFQSRYKYSSGEAEKQSKLSFNLNHDSTRTATEQRTFQCKENEADKLEDAQIHVSERGLLFSKDFYTTASPSPTTHVIDQNVEQRQVSEQNTPGDTDESSMTPVKAYSEVNIKDDVTVKVNMNQGQTPMFTRTLILNELRANDRDAMSDETTRCQNADLLQEEFTKTHLTDNNVPTSLLTEYANSTVFNDYSRRIDLSKREIASTLSLKKEHRHTLLVHDERSRTPVLTGGGLKMPLGQPKHASIPHSTERNNCNPLFDCIGVETTPKETKRSFHSTISPPHLTRSLSPILKKDASESAMDRPITPPSKTQAKIRQGNTHKNNLTSLNEHSKYQRPLAGDPHQFRNTELQKKPSINGSASVKKPTHAGKLKRDVLSTLNKDELKVSERANVVSKDETRIDGRLEQENEKNDSIKGHTFNLRNGSFKGRSKTPAVEIERSPKYPLEQKRSKTPLPVPTFIKSNTETSPKKILIDELKPKHQTHYIESFSRNFPNFPIDRRQFRSSDHQRRKSLTSFRNKRSNTVVLGKHDTAASTLLNRRMKEDNTLSGSVNSRKPSERERPKSAMSLRSAPRSTTMETVLTIPRNFKARNESKQMREGNRYFDSGKSTSEKEHDRTNRIPQSYKSHVKADTFLNLEHTNNGLTDSDSELEEFFANPEAEVLQLGN
ncbi:uncharacterized protein LOC123551947 [Mercenaria mercenaria]|uniref:uncharacterized protein LOC123551947 n=1 Tax=Mercenaria mercenaria TaxID=6596 RepID=UPI00234EACA5|nr:uncharacterized protein LOC123551947 [Mercenaria mercenaria]